MTMLTLRSRRVVRIMVFVLVTSIISTTFLNDADARRRRRRRGKQAKVINEKKLFERMGGKDAIARTVDEWIRLTLADSILSIRLKDMIQKPAELSKTRKLLSEEICELADGPCTTNDSEWVQVRTRLKMDEVTTVAFASLLSDAMQSRGVGERERNELLGRLGSVEPLAVSEATGPASERRGGTR
jgi:truncated hemoglobin YjbI